MKRSKGDVSWYIAQEKKPFAYSTTATSELIVLLCAEYKDLREVYKHIHYDEEAKRIVKRYIERGIYTIR